MLDFFNLQLPSGVNFQEFYGGGTTKDWVKPRGVSMVAFLLIGAGGGGRNGSAANGGQGGGSGGVSYWIGPALFIPDILRFTIGAGGAAGATGGNTFLEYVTKNSSYSLIRSNGGSSFGGSTAAFSFCASGIAKQKGGQNGATAANDATGIENFTQGGGGGASTTAGSGGISTPLYGYPSAVGGTTAVTGTNGANGYFISTPVLLGCGGGGGGGGSSIGGNGGNGGIGCGGGGGGRGGTTGGTGGRGGDGAAFAWSW